MLWRVSKPEWAQWCVACFVTLFGGVTLGIVASILLSVLLLLRQAAHPSSALLGQLPGTRVFVSLKRYPDAQELPGIKARARARAPHCAAYCAALCSVAWGPTSKTRPFDIHVFKPTLLAYTCLNTPFWHTQRMCMDNPIGCTSTDLSGSR